MLHKRRFIIIASQLTFIVMLMFATLPVLGESLSTLTLSIAPAHSAQAVVGGKVTVTLLLSNVVSVNGVEIDIAFDPSIVTVASGEVIPGSCPASSFVQKNEVDNIAGIIEYDDGGFPTCTTPTGIVATIEFTCLAVGITPLNITSSQILDGVAIPHTSQNSTFTVEHWGTDSNNIGVGFPSIYSISSQANFF